MAAERHLSADRISSDGSSGDREKRTPVQFVTDFSVYAAGEVAGFLESQARQLIAAGLAVVYEPSSIESADDEAQDVLVRPPFSSYLHLGEPRSIRHKELVAEGETTEFREREEREDMGPEKGSPAPLNRSKRRRLETRSKLVFAARKVMGEKGFDATTIRDITERADVGFGSFYSHFKSKAAILAVAFDEIMEGFVSRVENSIAAIDDPVEKVATVVSYLLRLIQADPISLSFVARIGSSEPETGMKLLACLRRDLERGTETNDFQCDDIEVTLAMVVGSFVSYLRGRSQGCLKDDGDPHAVLTVLRMMGADEERARQALAKLRRFPE